MQVWIGAAGLSGARRGVRLMGWIVVGSEFCEALRRVAPRFAKQVPRQSYALRMNRAEGSRDAISSGLS